MNAPITRRTSLKTLSLMTGSLLTPSTDLFARQPKPKKLGVALVGLGNYATRQLAPALLETKDCYLAGIVTGSPDKAKAWSTTYNIPPKNSYSYQTFDQIRNNPDIDIIYVVLPNFMHAEYTIRAAQAGKHVICEKPMAMNAAEARQMIDACRKAGVQLSVGYRLYFEPHHLEMRRMAAEKQFGAVKVIESGLGFTVPGPDSWRLDRRIGGGGAIMDLGVYAIQGARRTINEDPISVTAQAFTFDKVHFKDIHETVFWQFEFPGGTVAHCSTTYSSYVDRLYATCERGWFKLEPAFNATGAQGVSSSGPMDLPSPQYQQIAQLNAFSQSIRQKTIPEASGEEGWKDMKLIGAILQAADTGRKISIDWRA
ncbi:Gfo/Idh/MocA family protein [Spirosoma utsteinense]|uniref:Dehydrogenase n=1 Tax=Spirosoma utsteinense TaxID=2585773 RepID=A0ABR6WBL1_9BACT|nr:Gfo/Idh/MocA family oxidoreductase [Spirosoma utsteinense]MBC3788070.1 putative dehydrogenase [Spirosoma utsteinense]MBC3793955.1 putative dehydrogenase [Spirosoma utsteinense]